MGQRYGIVAGNRKINSRTSSNALLPKYNSLLHKGFLPLTFSIPRESSIFGHMVILRFSKIEARKLSRAFIEQSQIPVLVRQNIVLVFVVALDGT
jgi:hypothetical protein